MPDHKDLYYKNLNIPLLQKNIIFLKKKKELYVLNHHDCEYHPYIEDLNWLIETRIKEFRDEKVNQKQKEQDLDNYHMTIINHICISKDLIQYQDWY